LHSLERPHDVGAADTGKRKDDDGWRARFFDVFRQGREFCAGELLVRRGGSGEDLVGQSRTGLDECREVGEISRVGESRGRQNSGA
jgi:hypothetical protein